MKQLPVEIIELVFRHTVIDDLLSLRLVCHSFRTIIDARIESLGKQVARNTFPKARLLLRPSPNGICDFKWLKSLIPKRLAAIIVDKHRNRNRNRNRNYGVVTGIPAEEVFGDELRSKVENGWRVFKRLSNISKTVYTMPENELPPIESEIDFEEYSARKLADILKDLKVNATGPATTADLQVETEKQPVDTGSSKSATILSRCFRRLRRKARLQSGSFGIPVSNLDLLLKFQRSKILIIEKREHLIWKRSTQFIGELPFQDSSDYGLLHSLLFWPFQNATLLQPPRAVYGGDSPFVIFAFDFNWAVDRIWQGRTIWDASAINLIRANSWVNWYLLHEGPDMFWTQWNGETQDDRCNYIRDKLRLAWAERKEAQIAVERRFAIYVNNTMRIQASWKHGRYWQAPCFESSYRGYSSDSTLTFYQKYRNEDSDRGKSVITWYAWMNGVNVDDNFDAWAYHRAEGLPPLEDECFDSLNNVPYSIYL
jgi:hypothetical protein